jgi:uncharacterized protein with HEPN domain
MRSGGANDDLREGHDKTEIILYNLQLLGEDANNLSEEVCASHPEIDFKGLAGLRHRLVHDYANIDFDIVWNALVSDIPTVEELLTPIVATLPVEEQLPENLGDFE